MPQYAYFDHTVADPSPVVGWLDTDAFTYTTQPDAADLLELTTQEWVDHFDNPNGWAVASGALVAYTAPVPPPTADQVFQEKIAQGITVSSASDSTLNAVYPIDASSVALVGAIARDAAAGLGLPNDAPTIGVPDINGTPHAFDEPGLIALYKVERNLVQQLNQQRDVMAGGDTPVWPPQNASIP